MTVSDDLRVRSEPRVADDSIKYEPLLPLGTELTVLDGPVSGSGYTWYKVAPVSFTVLEGPGQRLGGHGRQGRRALDRPRRRPDRGDRARQGRRRPGPGRPRRREDRRRLDQRLRARSPAGHARRRDARARRERRLLPDEHRPRPRDGPGRCQGRDRQPRWTPSSTPPAGTRWDPASTPSTRPSRRATRRGRTSTTRRPTRELALRIANAAFAQRDWAIEQAYLERIASTFGAGVRLVDYQRRPRGRPEDDQRLGERPDEEADPGAHPAPGSVDDARPVSSSSTRSTSRPTWETEFSKDATKPEAVHPPRRLASRGPDDVAAGDRRALRPRQRLAGDRAAVPGAPSGRPRSP